MTTKQEWLDWVKAKRRAQAKMRKEIGDMEGGLRIGDHGRDLTAREISLLRQQIESVEKIVQDALN